VPPRPIATAEPLDALRGAATAPVSTRPEAAPPKSSVAPPTPPTAVPPAAIAPPSQSIDAPAVPAPDTPAASIPETSAAPAVDVPPAESAPAVAAAQPLYKDGTYSGWGTCRHGDIEATVVVDGGRIVSAAISQCQTRYPCSWISMLPPQVVSRQSAEVDFVSGATQSGDAFYYAIVQALSKAK
jgi:uncharacterized protein with FMN-binding domain